MRVGKNDQLCFGFPCFFYTILSQIKIDGPLEVQEVFLA